jgi:hypothetical protein
MHSLNHAVLGRVVANERSRRPLACALNPRRPERPPNLRELAAFAAARVARRLDHDTARRALA